jgi:tetratricopeptide (TPR) repeat protein
LNFLTKINTLIVSHSQNEVFDYLKYIIYGTDKSEKVEELDQAFYNLFGGLDLSRDGKYSSALELLEKALKTFQANEDRLGESFCFFFIGEVHAEHKDFEKACSCYKKAHEELSRREHRMASAIESKIKEMEL